MHLPLTKNLVASEQNDEKQSFIALNAPTLTHVNVEKSVHMTCHTFFLPLDIDLPLKEQCHLKTQKSNIHFNTWFKLKRTFIFRFFYCKWSEKYSLLSYFNIYSCTSIYNGLSRTHRGQINK